MNLRGPFGTLAVQECLRVFLNLGTTRVTRRGGAGDEQHPCGGSLVTKSGGFRLSQQHLFLGIVLSVAGTFTAFSQQQDSSRMFIQVTVGLGVSAHTDPTMVNYINALTLASPDQKLSDFTSASEFFVVPEVQVSETWSVGLEYSYLLKSYNSIGAVPWNFSYSAQMSTLLVHYLSPGDGYWLKFGGGVGYTSANFSEQFAESGASENAKASGPVFKLEAVGNTEFDEHFWGSIGLDLRWVYAGGFKGGIVNTVSPPKLDFFSAGVKFGVTVQM